jgi:hypothetical protein
MNITIIQTDSNDYKTSDQQFPQAQVVKVVVIFVFVVVIVVVVIVIVFM